MLFLGRDSIGTNKCVYHFFLFDQCNQLVECRLWWTFLMLSKLWGERIESMVLGKIAMARGNGSDSSLHVSAPFSWLIRAAQSPDACIESMHLGPIFNLTHIL